MDSHHRPRLHQPVCIRQHPFHGPLVNMVCTKNDAKSLGRFHELTCNTRRFLPLVGSHACALAIQGMIKLGLLMHLTVMDVQGGEEETVGRG